MSIDINKIKRTVLSESLSADGKRRYVQLGLPQIDGKIVMTCSVCHELTIDYIALAHKGLITQIVCKVCQLKKE